MSSFGLLLRDWRQRRRMSQLDLALEAEVSARHLSFLETGRARPSRPMILRLAEVLEAPLAARTDLLRSAGFAAAYSAAPLDDESLAPVREALLRLMTNHAPYPAMLLTRTWDLVDANQSAHVMFGGAAAGTNAIELLLTDGALRSRVLNLAEVMRAMVIRLHAESRVAGGDPRLDALAKRLGNDPMLVDDPDTDRIGPRHPFVPIRLRRDGSELALLSATAEIGTAESVTVRDLHLELFFPADEVTRDYFG
jgi:transcriptional regulator with XRE-family HTH domain